MEGFLSQVEATSAVDYCFPGGFAAGDTVDAGLSGCTCVCPLVLRRDVGGLVDGDNVFEKSRVFGIVRKKSFRCLSGDARSRKEIDRGIAFLHFPLVTHMRSLCGQYKYRMATSRWQQTWVLDRRWHG
eukprot:TRINITY_DN3046_c0_g1_i4.p1 TRINITY_DN3046_c0_g1~~TRINITY_DN3046_c0_g1_i4.p1  ORF type:complete len:128 (+),score=4.30 TRINITY_DN3046_c0_g1_i4:176-559(+)